MLNDESAEITAVDETAKRPRIDPTASELAGEYAYERVGFDRRPMELLPDGSIGRGAAAAEVAWQSNVSEKGREILISGRDGMTCRLAETNAGRFEGAWIDFEKMPVILTKTSPPTQRRIVSAIAEPPHLITGVQRRSAILERLAREDVPITQIIFGCLRHQKILCVSGSVRGGADDENWSIEDNALILGTATRQNAKYTLCDNPRELHGRWLLGDRPLSKLVLRSNLSVEVPGTAVSIVVGSYNQPEWTIANARACRALNPGCPVVVIDDCSKPEVIRQLSTASKRYGFGLQVLERNHGHYEGDAELLRAGIEFAHIQGTPYLVRCNQRTIQTRPSWATEVAARLANDDAAVAYQCYWDEPHNIRTEFLGISVQRWQPRSSAINYGKLAAEDISGQLYERWFSKLIWEHFPWQHTSIDWFSRSRYDESEFTLSYFSGLSHEAATLKINALTQGSPKLSPPVSGQIERIYAHAVATHSDIYEHLPTLRLFACQCKHVTEFGVRSGVSTAALLAGLVGREETQLVSFDLSRSAEVDMLECVAGSVFRFVIGDSRRVDIESTDMLFIDTFHTDEQLWLELTRHQKMVKRWIVMHDTKVFGELGEDGSSGLMAALERFLQVFPQWKLAATYYNNNGLTILQRELTYVPNQGDRIKL